MSGSPFHRNIFDPFNVEHREKIERFLPTTLPVLKMPYWGNRSSFVDRDQWLEMIQGIRIKNHHISDLDMEKIRSGGTEFAWVHREQRTVIHYCKKTDVVTHRRSIYQNTNLQKSAGVCSDEPSLRKTCLSPEKSYGFENYSVINTPVAQKALNDAGFTGYFARMVEGEEEVISLARPQFISLSNHDEYSRASLVSGQA